MFLVLQAIWAVLRQLSSDLVVQSHHRQQALSLPGCVPIEFYLQKQAEVQLGPWAMVCQLLV